MRRLKPESGRMLTMDFSNIYFERNYSIFNGLSCIYACASAHLHYRAVLDTDTCDTVICGGWGSTEETERCIVSLLSHEVVDAIVDVYYDANIHLTINRSGVKRCANDKYTSYPCGILFREKARRKLGIKRGEIV